MRSIPRKIATALATAVTLGALSLSGATPAFAAEQSKSETGSCWVDAITADFLCVDEGVDLVAAVMEEKGVRIIAPEGTNVGGKSYTASTMRADLSAQGSYVVGILYQDQYLAGSTLVFTSSFSTGCSSYAYGYWRLSDYGWNDRASSYRGFINCRSAVFEHENYSGSQHGYYTSASTLGAMNDKASSWRLAL